VRYESWATEVHSATINIYLDMAQPVNNNNKCNVTKQKKEKPARHAVGARVEVPAFIERLVLPFSLGDVTTVGLSGGGVGDF